MLEQVVEQYLLILYTVMFGAVGFVLLRKIFQLLEQAFALKKSGMIEQIDSSESWKSHFK